MRKRNDWGFWAITMFVGIGSAGGWVCLAAVALERFGGPVEIAGQIHDASQDPWEPLGSDSQGREFLRRTASNGDIERLTVMPDGVGLYVRCGAPDPFPDVSACAKLILRPRQ